MPTAPATYNLTRAFDVLSFLVAQVANAVTAAGLAAFPRVVVTTGTPADDECTCGTLIITASNIYRSNGFPRNDSGQAINCELAEIVISGAVRALRCAPMPDDNGHAPTATALTANASEVLQDAYAILTTLQCNLLALKNATPPQIVDYTLGDQTLITHEGGCSGSEVSFQIAFMNNFCGC